MARGGKADGPSLPRRAHSSAAVAAVPAAHSRHAPSQRGSARGQVREVQRKSVKRERPTRAAYYGGISAPHHGSGARAGSQHKRGRKACYRAAPLHLALLIDGSSGELNGSGKTNARCQSRSEGKVGACDWRPRRVRAVAAVPLRRCGRTHRKDCLAGGADRVDAGRSGRSTHLHSCFNLILIE